MNIALINACFEVERVKCFACVYYNYSLRSEVLINKKYLTIYNFLLERDNNYIRLKTCFI